MRHQSNIDVHFDESRLLRGYNNIASKRKRTSCASSYSVKSANNRLRKIAHSQDQWIVPLMKGIKERPFSLRRTCFQILSRTKSFPLASQYHHSNRLILCHGFKCILQLKSDLVIQCIINFRTIKGNSSHTVGYLMFNELKRHAE